MKFPIPRSIVAGAVLALSAGAAFAQSSSSENDRGFYAGAGLGQFNVKVHGIAGTLDEFDSDDLSWKIFAGYRLNRYLALEGAYVNFGEPTDDFSTAGSRGDYSIRLSGFAPYVVGTLPLGESFEAFAKLGYYFYDLKVRADLDDLGGNVFRSDDSGEDVVWAVGLGTTFMQRLNARLEYERIDAKGTSDANAFWLTGAWRF